MADSPTITIPDLPTDEDEELLRRFTVTHHYLRHLAIYLGHTYGKRDDVYVGIAAALGSHRPYLKIQRRTDPINQDDLRRHLEIAWISELQLRVPAVIGHNLALRYTNAWAPIHAYYSAYMLLQAWFDANGMPGLADDHTATLRSISGQIRERNLFPPPWSVLADGNVLGGTCTYINEPQPGVCAVKIEVLTVPVSFAAAFSEAEFWARFGTWLRTTREARLKKKEDDWKAKHGRKRIDGDVRQNYASWLHPISLFDCLWRMRIRSNYRSVETYLVQHVSDETAESFNKALVHITRANLFLLECYVARVLGAGTYEAMARNFLGRDPQGLAATTVGARLDLVVATAKTAGGGQVA